MNEFKFLTNDELLSDEAVPVAMDQPTAADDLKPSPHCHACGKPITTIAGPAIVFLDITGATPHRAEGTTSHLVCFACDPDCGYRVDLARLVRDGCFSNNPTNFGWVRHLRQKRWCSEQQLTALCEVYEWARTLAVPSAPPRPARERQALRTTADRSRRTISKRQRARILERDNFLCRRCGSTWAHGVRLVVDHIVPVALGGSSDDANLQTLCEPCNQGKAARPPHPAELASGTSVPLSTDAV